MINFLRYSEINFIFLTRNQFAVLYVIPSELQLQVNLISGEKLISNLVGDNALNSESIAYQAKHVLNQTMKKYEAFLINESYFEKLFLEKLKHARKFFLVLKKEASCLINYIGTYFCFLSS